MAKFLVEGKRYTPFNSEKALPLGQGESRTAPRLSAR
jgi:hypothetical protein